MGEFVSILEGSLEVALNIVELVFWDHAGNQMAGPSNLHQNYSSSSSPPSPSSFFSAALAFFLLTRPGRPPPNGDVRAKSICFWESRRTINDGTLTICFPTLPEYNHQP